MRYVYCHPLFDERKCAHRFSYQLKNTFQAAGSTLERFDYRGTGEAPGEFADISLQSLRDDIAQYICDNDVSIIGVRFGASLAFDYCARGQRPVRSLVLLEPIIDGSKYVDYLYRKQHIKNLMTGESPAERQDGSYENIEGYKTSVKFIEQIKNFHLIEAARHYATRNSVRIVQISSRSRARPEVVRLAKLLETLVKEVFVESVELPIFWERIAVADYTVLTRKILRWCRG